MDRHAQFTQTNDEKAALEKIVLKLKGQLNDLERIDLERQDLQTRLNALEAELKQTVKFYSFLFLNPKCYIYKPVIGEPL